MKVGIGLGSQLKLPFDDLVALAGPAVDLGFESVWTTGRTLPDAFHICEGWWQQSAQVRPGGAWVATGVLPAPKAWHPASLASLAATASLLTGGRFILGLGTGGYGPAFWDGLGLPNRPLAVMRDYIDILRAAFTGDSVHHDGKVLRLHNFRLEQRPPNVPIYLAALGPQMIRLAGRCADGVLMNWASTSLIARANQWLEEGARSAGRDRSEISLGMYLRCVVDDDVNAARRAIAAEILFKLSPRATDHRSPDGGLGYRGQFVRLGFEEEVEHLEQQFGDGATIKDLLDEVSPELCSVAGYYGTPADAPARVAQLTHGLDRVVIRVVPAHPSVEATLRAMEALAPAKILATSAA
jgi:alkanesulfonate monooxygenase SsuD/methylene tetrahydromethanopterin reductase-like flavin-dependent oxidoreductase (luciferase family)